MHINQSEMQAATAQLSLFHRALTSNIATEPPVAKLRQSLSDIEQHNRLAANRRRCAVKEHQASRHHFDLRLQFNRSLLSWAILEGPSLCPGVRRTAIQVADHDCRYMISEWVIPEGRRGAGPVLLWDEGFWISLPGCQNIQECLRDGCLKFVLECSKLKGAWILQRRSNGWNSQPNNH